jgi:hypothetical protein
LLFGWVVGHITLGNMRIPIVHRTWRVLGFVALAFLVAPAIPALALPYFTPLFSGFGFPRYDFRGVVFFYVASLIFGTLLGLPSFLVLRKLKLVRWWSAGLVGAAIGAGIALAFAGAEIPATFLSSWAGSGAIAAISCWFVLDAGGVFQESFIDGGGSHVA